MSGSSGYCVGDGPVLLHLFVAGQSSSARRARAQCRLLEQLAPGLAIREIDVVAEPAAAEAAGILATPALSNEGLSPPRRIVGDLGNAVHVLDFLGIGRSELNAAQD
jgi:hypothetical protein